LDFVATYFVLFSNHCRYLCFMFFQRGAIFGISRLLEIWRDPKTYSIMYMKDMLKDWSSPHLLDCDWYLDYLKENTPSLEYEIWKKHESGFLWDLELWKRRHQLRKNWRGASGRERNIIRNPHYRCNTRKMFPFNLN